MTEIDVLLEIFSRLDIKVKKSGNYYQCRAFWRDGDDNESVAIYPNTNLVVDFVEDKKYRIDQLLQDVLKLKSKEDFEGWLEENDFNIKFGNDITYIPRIKLPEIFPKSDLELIDVTQQDYLIGRGISMEVALELAGGVVKEGKMKNRYVWPIWNSKGNLVGFTGRTLVSKKPKYKHLGDKNRWCWPCHVNLKDIVRLKEIIIVESPMDVLSLMTAGIRNVVAINGAGMGLGLLNLLIKLNCKNIIISTNNDAQENGAGQKAALKIYNSLTRYFNKNQIEIFLPPDTKDWGEARTELGIGYIREKFGLDPFDYFMNINEKFYSKVDRFTDFSSYLEINGISRRAKIKIYKERDNGLNKEKTIIDITSEIYEKES